MLKKMKGVALCAMMYMAVGCVNEDEPIMVSSQEIEAELELPVESDGFATTRSVVYETSSGMEMYWGTSESIGVYGTSLTNSKFVSTNKYKETNNAVFSGGSLFKTPKYAYYPYSEDNASQSMTSVKGKLPQMQFFNTVTKKMNTDYKIGTYSSRTLFGYKFKFQHLLTFLKYTVNATGTALEGDELERITLTITKADGTPRQLWGGFTFDLTKANTEAITKWDAPEEGSNTLILGWSDTPVLSNNATYRGYLTAAPTSVPGDILHFEILTNKHKATFSRTSKATFKVNGLINYTLTLANFTDMVVEDVPQYVEPEETPAVTPVLSSMKFTVEKNQGKILSRTFSVSTSASVTTNTVTEAACTIDEENKKITLNLPYLNNRKLVPTFEIPEGTQLVYEGGEIISGETEVDFATYKQVAVVNSAGEAVIYNVELTNSGLPVVVVNQKTGLVTSESGDYQKASKTWYDATGTGWQPKESDWVMTEGDDNFMIYNADGTSALTDKNGAIVNEPILASTRVRGNVTQQMPKKPFAVKLDKKHGVLDMPSHKRWVLLANWKDRTLMRNAVAFGIADVFKNTLSDGMAWNPSGQFVELVYNGVHVGNYYLCEQVKIDGNRLDINDPYDVEDNSGLNVDEYGYLLECDDAYDETLTFTTANYIPFLFKDDGTNEMLTYAQTFVRSIEDNLYAGNYDAAYEKMDLTSLVDYWLIQELMMNSEMQHPKSVYMYINNGKFYAGPIWDFDWNTLPTSTSFAEEGYSYTTSMIAKAKCYHKSSGYPTEPLNESDKNYFWYPMLVKDAGFKSLAAERWNAVKGALQTYVSTQIPAMKDKIAASEAVNNKMWPVDEKGFFGIGSRYSTYGIGGGYCGDEGMSFADAINQMITTLNTRINGMNYVSNQSWPNITYGTK